LMVDLPRRGYILYNFDQFGTNPEILVQLKSERIPINREKIIAAIKKIWARIERNCTVLFVHIYTILLTQSGKLLFPLDKVGINTPVILG